MSEPLDGQPAEARRWLHEAEEEIHAARTILADPASPPRLACFIAHLAAEKAIKALLATGGQAVPRIHDLAELARRLPPEIQAQLDRDALEALTPWAIAGRYAGDLAETDTASAAGLVESAERVLQVAREIVARLTEETG